MKRRFNSKHEEDMEHKIQEFNSRLKFVFYCIVLIVVFSAVYSLSLCDVNGESGCSNLARFYLGAGKLFAVFFK